MLVALVSVSVLPRPAHPSKARMRQLGLRHAAVLNQTVDLVVTDRSVRHSALSLATLASQRVVET